MVGTPDRAWESDLTLNSREFGSNMDIDGENDMTYVSREHLYNEGGEGSILRGPLRDNQLFHRFGNSDVVDSVGVGSKALRGHAEDCIQLQTGEGD